MTQHAPCRLCTRRLESSATAVVVSVQLARMAEAATARSDLFERRLLLMDDWASYLAGKGR